MSEKIAETKSYCNLCKNELLTDFEKDKGQHWECHSELLDFNAEEMRTIEEYIKIFKIIRDSERQGLYMDMPLYLQKGMPTKLVGQVFHAIIEIVKEKWGLDYEGEFPVQGIGFQPLRPAHVDVYRQRYDNNRNHENRRPDWLIDINLFGGSQRKIQKLTWFDYINTTIPDGIYIIITGFILDSDKGHVKEVVIWGNGIMFPVINLEYAYALKKNVMFLSKPFAVSEKNPFRVNLILDDDITKSEKFGLLGFAIAKRHALINEYL